MHYQVNSVFFTGSIKSDIHQNAIHIIFFNLKINYANCFANKKVYCTVSQEKVLFQSFYIEMSCLINVTCCLVIICVYQQFLSIFFIKS